MVFESDRYIVKRESGPQTTSGAGDILIDNYGHRYREVDSAEAQSLRNTTGAMLYTFDRYGRLR